MKKTLEKIGEFGLIDLIRKKVGIYPSIPLGIGDDTAVLPKTSQNELFTMDLLVEDVDFSFHTATPEQVGRKALAVNLSDIAAMGGKPKSAVVGLVLPRQTALDTVKSFYDGMIAIAKKFGVVIVGGDLSQGPCWMISVALLGEVSAGNRAILRSGAKTQDLICVTGEFGGSILKKHIQFTPRVKEGEFLAAYRVNSMIDVSDGLFQDLGQILCASNVSAQIWADQIPISEDTFKLSRQNSEEALKRALTDGEDFELLFTIPNKHFVAMKRIWKKKFQVGVKPIGKIVSGRGCKITFLKYGKEIKITIPKKGYNHFA